jgi:prepilin-type N-terminal cleavage/methylation domain-containing protein
MKTDAPCRKGFTLVEIMIVVAIIGLLGAIALPNFVQARKTSQTDACINNLRQIDGAKQQFALEAGKTTDYTPVAGDIQPYLGRGDTGSLTRVYCPLVTPLPMGGYTINAVGTPPICTQYDATNHPSALD